MTRQPSLQFGTGAERLRVREEEVRRFSYVEPVDDEGLDQEVVAGETGDRCGDVARLEHSGRGLTFLLARLT